MRQICVLFTKYSDIRSRIVYFTTGLGYTHSSIALEDSENAEYYSFNYREFTVETLEKHKRRGVKESLCVKIMVSDESYEIMRNTITEMKNHKDEYSYSPLGVALMILGIPLHFGEKNYICSQFVAELLEKSKRIKFRKKTYLYSPNTLLRTLVYSPGYLLSVRNII